MKKILITGGSGTIGSAFINKYSKDYSILSFARNEKSQVSLKRKFPEIEILLGSVENSHELEYAYTSFKPDIVIHSAALKHVDTAEKQPSLAVKSNIIGSLNIIKCSTKFNTSVTIGISTDKACNPDNIYGQTKYMMERIFQEFDNPTNRFVNCRFGNVAWSNGSVLPYWLRLANKGKSLPVTDVNMTRLIFTEEEAAELIEESIKLSYITKEYFILSKKMKKVNMLQLAKLISNKIHIVGLRPGEKIDESLISSREIEFTKNLGDYILLTPGKHQDRDNLINGALTSKSADSMSEDEMKNILSQVVSKNKGVNEETY